MKKLATILLAISLSFLMAACSTNTRIAASELPEGYEVVGTLTLVEDEPDDNFQTKAENLNKKEVWMNANKDGWAYVLMDWDDHYHLFRPYILQCRWLYHNGSLYIDCLDRDIFYGTEWYDAVNEYLGGGRTPSYELMPDDAMLLGRTAYDGNSDYPDTELGISWSTYSGKEVYADPNNSDVLFLLYPNGVAPTVNNGVRVDIYLLYEFKDNKAQTVPNSQLVGTPTPEASIEQ